MPSRRSRLRSQADGSTDDALIVVEETAGAFKPPDGFEEIERRQYDDTEFTILRRNDEGSA